MVSSGGNRHQLKNAYASAPHSPRAGGSTTRSENQNYGVWGQKNKNQINFTPRNASPTFGGGVIASKSDWAGNKSDWDNTSVISEGSTNMGMFKSKQAFLTKKQIARCTYS